MVFSLWFVVQGFWFGVIVYGAWCMFLGFRV
jgi:hypothetical protein